MNKSCVYCGGIHPRGYVCKMKPKSVKKSTIATRFRNSRQWREKVEEIKKRDLYLCQCCIRGIGSTDKLYNYNDLQVHHAIPIIKDYEKRLDNDNLISLCPCCHKLAENGKIPYKIIKQIIAEQEVKYELISPPNDSYLK